MTERTTSQDRSPLVSAVVVVFGAHPDRLDRCLAALRTSRGVRVEIILVDNGSPVPVTHPLADRVVRRAVNGGFAAGVNEGVALATGDVIAVVNDDAVVDADALARCSAALATSGERCLAAAPKVLFADTDRPFLDSAGVVIRPTGEAFSAGAGQPDLGQFDTDLTVLGPCWSTAVLRRDAFERIGPLDERYFLYYEDVDWALRCFLSGHDTVFVPTAIVHHEHAASTRSLGERRRFRLVQRNLLLCATVNLGAASVARVWMQCCVGAAKAMIKGPDRTSRLVALWTALVRTPATLPTRRKRRAAVCRSDREAFSFAEGLVPYVDVEHYRPTDLEAATRAAQTRRARMQADR